MHRLLLDFPSLHLVVRSADAFVMLSIVATIWLGPRWAGRLEGIDPRGTRRALLVLAVVTLAGGRLHFLLNYWEAYASRPLDALKLWTGGLHIGGGIVALVLAAPRVTRAFGVPVGKFGDGIAPMLGLAVVIARLGCFLQGCCFGRVCALPWAITFPSDSTPYLVQLDMHLLDPGAPRSLPVHPLQLYFAGVGLLVTLTALWLHPRRRFPGEVALVSLLVFSLGAAGLEGFREDYQPRAYWGSLPQLTWTALAMSAASLAALLVAELVHHRRARMHAPALTA